MRGGQVQIPMGDDQYVVFHHAPFQHAAANFHTSFRHQEAGGLGCVEVGIPSFRQCKDDDDDDPNLQISLELSQKKAREIMRQVSGLGMEDPVFGLSSHHSMMQKAGKLLPNNGLYDDMHLTDIPMDMRDMLSVCSDPTASLHNNNNNDRMKKTTSNKQDYNTQSEKKSSQVGQRLSTTKKKHLSSDQLPSLVSSPTSPLAKQKQQPNQALAHLYVPPMTTMSAVEDEVIPRSSRSQRRHSSYQPGTLEVDLRRKNDTAANFDGGVPKEEKPSDRRWRKSSIAEKLAQRKKEEEAQKRQQQLELEKELRLFFASPKKQQSKKQAKRQQNKGASRAKHNHHHASAQQSFFWEDQVVDDNNNSHLKDEEEDIYTKHFPLEDWLYSDQHDPKKPTQPQRRHTHIHTSKLSASDSSLLFFNGGRGDKAAASPTKAAGSPTKATYSTADNGGSDTMKGLELNVQVGDGFARTVSGLTMDNSQIPEFSASNNNNNNKGGPILLLEKDGKEEEEEAELELEDLMLQQSLTLSELNHISRNHVSSSTHMSYSITEAGSSIHAKSVHDRNNKSINKNLHEDNDKNKYSPVESACMKQQQEKGKKRASSRDRKEDQRKENHAKNHRYRHHRRESPRKSREEMQDTSLGHHYNVETQHRSRSGGGGKQNRRKTLASLQHDLNNDPNMTQSQLRLAKHSQEKACRRSCRRSQSLESTSRHRATTTSQQRRSRPRKSGSHDTAQRMLAIGNASMKATERANQIRSNFHRYRKSSRERSNNRCITKNSRASSKRFSNLHASMSHFDDHDAAAAARPVPPPIQAAGNMSCGDLDFVLAMQESH